MSASKRSAIIWWKPPFALNLTFSARFPTAKVALQLASLKNYLTTANAVPMKSLLVIN